MKFSKGKVAALAIAGVVALGGISGSIAWGIKEVASKGGVVTTDDAITVKYAAGTDIDTAVTMDPYGAVRKQVTVKGNKSQHAAPTTGTITFTFKSEQQPASPNVRIRITQNSDYSSNEKDIILNSKKDLETITTTTYDFPLDNTDHSYYLEFTLVGTESALTLAETTKLGTLNIALGNK